MKQEEDNKKKNDKEDDGSFLSRLTEYFIKLLDKFTDGKYSTKEEQEFFADEKNLYDEKGNITPEYQKRLDEFEEEMKSKNVDDFLMKIHREDSSEFGKAYGETEMTILKSGLEHVSLQQNLVSEIMKAKKNAKLKGIPFDFDHYLKKKVEQEGENLDETIGNIRQYVIEHIEEIAEECPELAEYLDVPIDVFEIVAAKKNAKLKGIPFDFDDYLKRMIEQGGRDFEDAKAKIRQYVIEHIEEIAEECPELVEYLGVQIDVTNSNDKREEDNSHGTH